MSNFSTYGSVFLAVACSIEAIFNIIAVHLRVIELNTYMDHGQLSFKNMSHACDVDFCIFNLQR